MACFPFLCQISASDFCRNLQGGKMSRLQTSYHFKLFFIFSFFVLISSKSLYAEKVCSENGSPEYQLELVQGNLSRKDVNSFDRLIMNPYSKPLDYAGTGFAALSVLTPALLFALPDAFCIKDIWKIGFEYVQTMGLAYLTKELVKMNVDRARPYMYFDGAPLEKFNDGDWNDSFFSGHTTLSFSAATFTSIMYSRYFPESRYKPLVIGLSYSLAAVTAVLRISSGNHFMTDVLCGAAAGCGIGLVVPLLNSLWFKPSVKNRNFLDQEQKASVSVSILPQKCSLSLSLSL